MYLVTYCKKMIAKNPVVLFSIFFIFGLNERSGDCCLSEYSDGSDEELSAIPKILDEFKKLQTYAQGVPPFVRRLPGLGDFNCGHNQNAVAWLLQGVSLHYFYAFINNYLKLEDREARRDFEGLYDGDDLQEDDEDEILETLEERRKECTLVIKHLHKIVKATGYLEALEGKIQREFPRIYRDSTIIPVSEAFKNHVYTIQELAPVRTREQMINTERGGLRVTIDESEFNSTADLFLPNALAGYKDKSAPFVCQFFGKLIYGRSAQRDPEDLDRLYTRGEEFRQIMDNEEYNFIELIKALEIPGKNLPGLQEGESVELIERNYNTENSELRLAKKSAAGEISLFTTEVVGPHRVIE